MRKTIKLLLLVSLSVALFTGCSSAQKNEAKKDLSATMSKSLTPVIQKAFSCSSSVEIEKDLIVKFNELLKVKEDGVDKSSLSIGSVICVTAVKSVLPAIVKMAGGKLPVKWDCSLDYVGSKFEDGALKLCDKF